MLFQERDTDNVSLTVHRWVSQQEAGQVPLFHNMCSSIDCSTALCLQCHESAFTNIFLFPASHISICKQHIIHIPITEMSEGNNLCLQSEVSKHTGVCFWRLVMCTVGAGNACLERKGVQWSCDAVLPTEEWSPGPVRKSV